MNKFRIGLLGALLASATAQAQNLLPPPALDQLSEEELRDVDNAQLRILRKALHGCRAPGMSHFISPKKDPCVIMSTDREIAQSGDDVLEAFHWALPQGERYDENRSTTTWRLWLAH